MSAVLVAMTSPRAGCVPLSSLGRSCLYRAQLTGPSRVSAWLALAIAEPMGCIRPTTSGPFPSVLKGGAFTRGSVVPPEYSVPYASGPTQADCHPELAKDPRPKRSTRRVCGSFDFARRLASLRMTAHDDTALRERVRNPLPSYRARRRSRLRRKVKPAPAIMALAATITRTTSGLGRRLPSPVRSPSPAVTGRLVDAASEVGIPPHARYIPLASSSPRSTTIECAEPTSSERGTSTSVTLYP